MQHLQQLDSELEVMLSAEGDVDPELLQQLLQQREQILRALMAQSELLEKTAWQAAVERTSCLLEQICLRRDRSASQLQRLQHGQRSMQVYNKFR
ncbi:flagellar rod protein FlaI [uncultured Photobacterium sp.]|uniref:flagellar rod protein FlaI n=1 Tax=uncultured Photobacterium sp. TaxID=173973 RepID=UPI002637DA0F|nr:flagellar rod protein FlaI [uncultured Photobacterium sp.]